MIPPDTIDPAPPLSSAHVGGLLLRGSSWMIAMRFGIRGIGLVSTVILARVLTPADFGVVAMAMLVIGIIEVFGDTGQQLALIRHENPERAHFDSAWTMSVMINSTLTLVILAVAPFSDRYFHDARIVPVIQLLSLRVFLGGFVNIGIVNFRRHLDFAREFRFGLLRKVLTFGVTLTLALVWRSYWALAVGTVVGHVLEVALSYLMHPYRPRFDLSKVKELWSYSIWILTASLGRFFEGRIDEVVVAGVAPPSSVGQYTVGAELGGLPVTEVLDPVARALFPNYARVAGNPETLGTAYLQALSATATIAALLGGGIALMADDFVAVMLGPKWTETAPLVVWFAIAAGISGIGNSVFPVLNAAGESRGSAIQTWLRVAFFVPMMLWAASTGTLLYIAITKVAVELLVLPTFFLRLRSVLPLAWSRLLSAIWRPPVAAALMALVSIQARPIVGLIEMPLLRLLLGAVLAGAVFAVTQLGLWAVAGFPDGVEKNAVGILKSLRRAR